MLNPYNLYSNGLDTHGFYEWKHDVVFAKETSQNKDVGLIQIPQKINKTPTMQWSYSICGKEEKDLFNLEKIPK